MDWPVTRLPETRCPACNVDISAASDPRNERSPKANDYSLCIHCAAVLIFNDDLTLRIATANDMAEMSDDGHASIGRYQQAILMMNAMKKIKAAESNDAIDCPEFDCKDCGRHIISVGSTALQDLHGNICAACWSFPGWFNDPEVARMIDPEGNRTVKVQ
jgi:hypothetical protein